MSVEERLTWAETARVGAILDSCKLSLKSVRSGVRCYQAYVGEVVCFYICDAAGSRACTAGAVFPEVKAILPPRLEVLLAWSTLFRSVATAASVRRGGSGFGSGVDALAPGTTTLAM